MKSLIVFSLFCLVGCASDKPIAVSPEVHPFCPVAEKASCSDRIMLLDEDSLKRGTTCPENTRLVFPSYYQQGKVLVLCQCK